MLDFDVLENLETSGMFTSGLLDINKSLKESYNSHYGTDKKSLFVKGTKMGLDIFYCS